MFQRGGPLGSPPCVHWVHLRRLGWHQATERAASEMASGDPAMALLIFPKPTVTRVLLLEARPVGQRWESPPLLLRTAPDKLGKCGDLTARQQS